MSICFKIRPAAAITGQITVPGDKSISHRAIILGAIAEGVTTVKGFLASADTLATVAALKKMGVAITIDQQTAVVNGVGLLGLTACSEPLDFGNSGTSVRLITGILAAQSFNSELIGDSSLMTRPMQRIIEPLRLMNAELTCSEQGTLPITISGGQQLQAIDYQLPIASAQLKSCLLLAGLYAQGKTTLTEDQLTRDHTERLLRAFAHPVTKNNNHITVTNAKVLVGTEITVPADFSSAAFFIVAATIVPGSHLILDNIGINPSRSAMLTIMQLMGADIELRDEREQSGEPVATIHIKSSKLTGINIPEALAAIAIDDLPVILIAAACANGNTKLSNARELRVKESDRIRALSAGFIATGIKVTVIDDDILIEGGQFNGGRVDSYGDHRIAMAFAVAGTVAKQPIVVSDCENVNTSFPNFVELSQQIGMHIDYV